MVYITFFIKQIVVFIEEFKVISILLAFFMYIFFIVSNSCNIYMLRDRRTLYEKKL